MLSRSVEVIIYARFILFSNYLKYLSKIISAIYVALYLINQFDKHTSNIESRYL